MEKEFSINKRMLMSKRASLNLDIITSIRLIKDAMGGGKAKDISITKEMIQFYKEAYSKYKAQKELELSEKESKKSEKKENISTPALKRKVDRMVEFKNVIDSTQLVIEEDNEKLKRKCMQEIENAQALIECSK